jgi:hypothetical protein
MSFARSYEGKANALLSIFANQSKASAEVLEQLLPIQLLENASLGESLGSARLELMKRSQGNAPSNSFASQTSRLEERNQELSTLSESLAVQIAASANEEEDIFLGLRSVATNMHAKLVHILNSEISLLISSTVSGSSIVRPLPSYGARYFGVLFTGTL